MLSPSHSILLFVTYPHSSPVGLVHFVRGAADLQGGPYFFQMGKAEEHTSAGCSTFAGVARPRGPPPTLQGCPTI